MSPLETRSLRGPLAIIVPSMSARHSSVAMLSSTRSVIHTSRHLLVVPFRLPRFVPAAYRLDDELRDRLDASSGLVAAVIRYAISGLLWVAFALGSPPAADAQRQFPETICGRGERASSWSSDSRRLNDWGYCIPVLPRDWVPEASDFNCPQGQMPASDRDGPYCLPPPPRCGRTRHPLAWARTWYCDTNLEQCPPGSKDRDGSCYGVPCVADEEGLPWCRRTSLCSRTVPSAGTYLEQELVTGACADGTTCADVGTTCVTRERWVVPPRPDCGSGKELRVGRQGWFCADALECPSESVPFVWSEQDAFCWPHPVCSTDDAVCLPTSYCTRSVIRTVPSGRTYAVEEVTAECGEGGACAVRGTSCVTAARTIHVERITPFVEPPPAIPPKIRPAGVKPGFTERHGLERHATVLRGAMLVLAALAAAFLIWILRRRRKGSS